MPWSETLSRTLPKYTGAIVLAIFIVIFFASAVPVSVLSWLQGNPYRCFQPEPPPLHCIHIGTVGEDGTLFGALIESGVPPTDADVYVRALATVFDPRHSRSVDSFDVRRTENGELLSMRFVRSVRERYAIAPYDTGYRAWRIPVHEAVYITGFTGTIETSLWDAMFGKVADVELILSLADVFAWQIDFLTEPQPNDRFRLVYEAIYVDTTCVGVGDILVAEYRFDDDTVQGFIYPDTSGRLVHYDADGGSLHRAFLKAPLQYRRISSYFSYSRMHPILKYRRPHLGVDYAAPTGTPVSALGDGTITFRGWKGGYGKYIEVTHGGGYVTCYGHLSKYEQGQSVGTRVHQGEVIGYVGSTGLSTGPHLDFRIRKDGRYRDPLTVDMPPAEPLPDSLLPLFRVRRDELLSALYELAPLPGESCPPQAVCRRDTTAVSDSTFADSTSVAIGFDIESDGIE